MNQTAVIVGDFSFKPKPGFITNLFYDSLNGVTVLTKNLTKMYNACGKRATQNLILQEDPDLLVVVDEKYEDLVSSLNTPYINPEFNDYSSNPYVGTTDVGKTDILCFTPPIPKDHPTRETIEETLNGEITFVGYQKVPTPRPETVKSLIQRSSFVIGTDSEIPLLLPDETPFGILEREDEIGIESKEDLIRISDEWESISNTIKERTTTARGIVLQSIEEKFEE